VTCVEEHDRLAQSLGLTPIEHTFGMNFNADCKPSHIAQQQCLTSLMIFCLNGSLYSAHVPTSSRKPSQRNWSCYTSKRDGLILFATLWKLNVQKEHQWGQTLNLAISILSEGLQYRIMTGFFYSLVMFFHIRHNKSFILCLDCTGGLQFWSRKGPHQTVAIKGNTLFEGVCIRLTWHIHNHDMTHVMNMKVFYACLWQLSLSVIHSVMSFLMQRWHYLT